MAGSPRGSFRCRSRLTDGPSFLAPSWFSLRLPVAGTLMWWATSLLAIQDPVGQAAEALDWRPIPLPDHEGKMIRP